MDWSLRCIPVCSERSGLMMFSTCMTSLGMTLFLRMSSTLCLCPLVKKRVSSLMSRMSVRSMAREMTVIFLCSSLCVCGW